jgi:hypothetical protein
LLARRSLMRRRCPGSLTFSAPIIDMHLHAVRADSRQVSPR